MKYLLQTALIILLAAPAVAQQKQGSAAAPAQSKTGGGGGRPCVTCPLGVKGGPPPVWKGQGNGNNPTPQTNSGNILLDNNANTPSVFSQFSNALIRATNFTRTGFIDQFSNDLLYLDFRGVYGNLDNAWPTQIQASRNFNNGANISVFPAEQDNDPYLSPPSVVHKDVSGGIVLTSTSNFNLPTDNSGLPTKLEGPSFVLQQFIDTDMLLGGDISKYWPTLLSVSKKGDVVVGDPHYHSYRNGDEQATGTFVGRAAGGANQYYAGSKLFFSEDENLTNDVEVYDNSCPLFMQRFNRELYNSELRVNIGWADAQGLNPASKQRILFGAYDNTLAWHNAAAIYNNGYVYATKVVVTADPSTYPDYVFAPTYRLAPLQEEEQQIKQLGHLPGMPSAADVEKKGMDLGEQNRLLVEKVEELTLHLIRMQKELDALKAEKK